MLQVMGVAWVVYEWVSQYAWDILVGNKRANGRGNYPVGLAL